jgi:hypothetical protein
MDEPASRMPTYIAAAVIVLLGYVLIPVAAGLWVGKRIRLPETYPTIRRVVRGAHLVACIILLIYTLVGLLVVEDPALGVPVTLALMAGFCVLIAGPGELFLFMVRRIGKK